MELTDILNESVKHRFVFLRSEDQVLNDDEIDLLGLDQNLFKEFVRMLVMNGLVLDSLSFNSPHIKLTNYKDCSFKKKEFDLVYEVCFFDKSRCFKLLKNTDNLTFKKNMIKGMNMLSLNEYDRYIMLLMHSYTDKKVISKKYKEELRAIREQLNKKKLDIRLKNFKLNKSLFFLVEKEFYSARKTLKQTLRLSLFCYGCITQTTYLVSFLIKKSSRVLRTIKNKIFKFKVLVFMGADGSGKTTTINELISHLGAENCYYVHMGNKSNFLPTTKLLNYFRANKKTSSLSNNQKLPSFSIKSIIKSFIFNTNLHAETLLHMSWIFLKNKLFLKKKYILVDRYIYDRYSSGDAQFKYKMHISPDYIFLLDANIETLLARKQEHSKEVIERFRQKYLDFILNQNISKCARINSENDIYANLNLICRILNDEH